jgi:hypothetical protein
MGTRKYPVELRERAVRLYRESDPKPVIRRLAEITRFVGNRVDVVVQVT